MKYYLREMTENLDLINKEPIKSAQVSNCRIPFQGQQDILSISINKCKIYTMKCSKMECIQARMYLTYHLVFDKFS